VISLRKTAPPGLPGGAVIACTENDPMITKTDVAKHFKVSRTTLNASLQREGISA